MQESPGKIIYLYWFLLTFNAGCINAGGFMGAGRFVSHVTGFATLFGLHLAKFELEAAIGILSVPVFFLIGAIIAGLLIDRQIHLGRKPHYDYVMLISAVCLGLAALAGIFDRFPEFGQTFHLKHTYFLLVLLCLASGLQNAAITSSSGNSVRTTHLTGIATDLGLGIARQLTFRAKDPRTKKEIEANWLRIGAIISFAAGSAIGAWLFIKIRYGGFILPFLIALYSAFHARGIKMAHLRMGGIVEPSKG
jgi:uncharacterized membrane protein YoaK (UPF0700 family)